MSSSQLGQPNVYSASFVLNNGVLAPAQTANFNSGSVILSIQRTAFSGAGGVPRAVRVESDTAQAGDATLLGVSSTSAADDCTYQVTWINYYTPSTLTQGITGITAAAPYGVATAVTATAFAYQYPPF